MAGQERLPPRRSLSWGCEANQGANVVEPEKVEHAISYLLGQVHAFNILFQLLANAHPDPQKLLSKWSAIEQSGLANIEAQPIPDAGVDGYRFAFGGVHKALEAAAADQRIASPAISSEMALGQGLGATVLLGVLLKSLVQKGSLSDPEVAEILDQALLGMEKLQGTQGAPKKAVERARGVLEGLLSSFSPSRPKP